MGQGEVHRRALADSAAKTATEAATTITAQSMPRRMETNGGAENSIRRKVIEAVRGCRSCFEAQTPGAGGAGRRPILALGEGG